MKNLIQVAVVSVIAAVASGCATTHPIGGVLTDVTLPTDATSNAGGSKVGRSKCTSVLSLIAQGDCSIEAAKKDAGITKVSHVDWKANSILGIIGNYETVVYGE